MLVTTDDAMPADHGPLLKQLGLTLVIIVHDPPIGYALEAWEAELIHRWAHRIEMQAGGAVMRYSARGAAVWKPRRRPRPSI